MYSNSFTSSIGTPAGVTARLALVFISHDERIIRGVADQVMVMDKGKIVETGAAADVIGYPTHSVSKRLFAPYATFGETGRP